MILNDSIDLILVCQKCSDETQTQHSLTEKIKGNLKECCAISGGTWLLGDLSQAPVALEFRKKKAGFYSVFIAILRDWQKGDRPKYKTDDRYVSR